MESPMTTECEALQQEVEMLAAENQRLTNELNELRRVPAYPENAVRAVWEHGYETGFDNLMSTPAAYNLHAEEVSRIFVEALRDA